ncbi:hypothetical protein Zm00014a_029494 [Zea mays]|uniref:Uncharacterized protein n=1 Tax=Zea mays TaxID=4577 RepID=A0A3L6DXG6_MAIZE|nr:hypothetical protein Zm00014a_029494 [Zea mays]
MRLLSLNKVGKERIKEPHNLICLRSSVLTFGRSSCCCGSPQPSSCRMRRVRQWTSTSPGSAWPRTESSLPRIMPLSRSTLATWMRMACTMSLHHVCSLWVCPCLGDSPGCDAYMQLSTAIPCLLSSHCWHLTQ